MDIMIMTLLFVPLLVSCFRWKSEADEDGSYSTLCSRKHRVTDVTVKKPMNGVTNDHATRYFSFNAEIGEFGEYDVEGYRNNFEAREYRPWEEIEREGVFPTSDSTHDPRRKTLSVIDLGDALDPNRTEPDRTQPMLPIDFERLFLITSTRYPEIHPPEDDDDDELFKSTTTTTTDVVYPYDTEFTTETPETTYPPFYNDTEIPYTSDPFFPIIGGL